MGELQNGNGPSRRGYAERFAPRFSKNLPLSIPILARGFSLDRVSIPETQNIKQHEGEKLTGIMATISTIKISYFSNRDRATNSPHVKAS